MMLISFYFSSIGLFTFVKKSKNMKNKISFYFTIALLFSFLACGQEPSEPIEYQEIEITNPLHLANIGKITFSDGYIPLDEYSESDFLNTFDLMEGANLNMRAFLKQPLANSLRTLAPEMSATEIVTKGNFQFTFIVDGKKIYTENLNFGAGGASFKTSYTAFSQPLASSQEEDMWGRFMWSRFMERGGGRDALPNGTHQLKIEIRPYVELDEIKVGNILAEGELQLNVFEKYIEVAESDMAVQPIAPNSGWEISNENFDKEKIQELNKFILQNRFKDIASIVVIKNGKLLLEEYFNGAERASLHNPRSVGKTFASTMTGIAIEEGHLKNENQTLNEFYDLKKYKNYSKVKEEVSIKNLLTMSSAFEGSDESMDSPGNEEYMYPTDNWVKFTLDLKMDNNKTNGKQWDYFTAGCVVLGDILHQKVPGGLEAYTTEKLFKPLGINEFQWQYTPQNVANTAGGLQLRAVDFAKYGQLYKNRGAWNGQQIITENWVNKSFTKHQKLAFWDEGDYGYLFWNKKYIVDNQEHETFYCTGNGGNKIFVFTDQPLVIVVTATAYGRSYAHPQVDKMMTKFILPAVL